MDRMNEDALVTSSDYEFILSDLGPVNPLNDSPLPFLESSPLNTHDHQIQNFGHGIQNNIVPDSSVNGPINNETPAVMSQSPTGQIPSRENFPGPLDFEVELDNYSYPSNKRTWVYSVLLNKVFIDMHKMLLLRFRVNGTYGSAGLWVRALPVFSCDDLVSTPVQRCGIHELPEDTQREAHKGNVCNCKAYNWARHVIQTTHSKVHYDYDPESDRHSVMVPLDDPQAGTDSVSVGYTFTCKTSCAAIRGMNRKPIDVIFTLETDQREVLGRNVLPVKICSCPKRDKDKEEAANKDPAPVISGKRRMSAADREEHTNERKIKRELRTPSKDDSPVNQEGEGDIPVTIAQNEEQMIKLDKKLDAIKMQVEGMKMQMEQMDNKLTAFMQLFLQN